MPSNVRLNRLYLKQDWAAALCVTAIIAPIIIVGVLNPVGLGIVFGALTCLGLSFLAKKFGSYCEEKGWHRAAKALKVARRLLAVAGIAVAALSFFPGAVAAMGAAYGVAGITSIFGAATTYVTYLTATITLGGTVGSLWFAKKMRDINQEIHQFKNPHATKTAATESGPIGHQEAEINPIEPKRSHRMSGCLNTHVENTESDPDASLNSCWDETTDFGPPQQTPEAQRPPRPIQTMNDDRTWQDGTPVSIPNGLVERPAGQDPASSDDAANTVIK